MLIYDGLVKIIAKGCYAFRGERFTCNVFQNAFAHGVGDVRVCHDCVDIRCGKRGDCRACKLGVLDVFAALGVIQHHVEQRFAVFHGGSAEWDADDPDKPGYDIAADGKQR